MHRWLTIVLILILLALISIGGYAYLQNRATEETTNTASSESASTDLPTTGNTLADIQQDSESLELDTSTTDFTELETAIDSL